jgi:hypothetical protein
MSVKELGELAAPSGSVKSSRRTRGAAQLDKVEYLARGATVAEVASIGAGSMQSLHGFTHMVWYVNAREE